MGEPADTAHLTFADGDIVSMTQTIRSAFASKVTVPGTGMLLNTTRRTLNDPPTRATVAASIN